MLENLIYHGIGAALVVTPLTIAATVLLIACMALREVTSSLEGQEWRAVSRYLGVAIVPLLLVFGMIIVELLIAFVRNPPPLH